MHHQSDPALAGAIKNPTSLSDLVWMCLFWDAGCFILKPKARQRLKLAHTQRRRLTYDYVPGTVLQDYFSLY